MCRLEQQLTPSPQNFFRVMMRMLQFFHFRFSVLFINNERPLLFMKLLKWYYLLRGFFIFFLIYSFVSVYLNPDLFSILFIPANAAGFLLVRYLFYGRKNQDPSDRRLVLLIGLSFLWVGCVVLVSRFLGGFSFSSNACLFVMAMSVLFSGLA